MPAYVVVNIEVKDPARYEEYKTQVPLSIAKYGGKYLTRGGAVTALEGTFLPKRMVLLEFPSAAQARAWWDSPEYAAPKALRQSIAVADILLMEGLS